MRTTLNHDHHLPFCLHCSPHGYIRMIQHMIERCLVLGMSRDECVEALAKHAGIEPAITLSVWRELIKENKDFFHAYFQANSLRPHPYCQDIPSLRYDPLHMSSLSRGRETCRLQY